MTNRRSEKLDRFLGKRVEVIFNDGDVVEGTLVFDKPYDEGEYVYPNMYALTELDNRYIETLFFRKSHVKSIREVKE